MSSKLPAILLMSFYLLVCMTRLAGQVPTSDNYNSYGTTNAFTTRLVNVHPVGAPNLIYSYMAPPVITGSTYMFLGQPVNTLFRQSDNAFYFNFTSGDVVPGAGQSGNSDYRIHFSNLDTNVKLGDFWLRSVYLAIGAGNTANVTILGYRGSQSMSIGFITLSSNSSTIQSSSTDISYNGTDAYSGTYLSFGTNWQYLDGIRIICSADIPIAIDDIDFDFPTSYPPTFQAGFLTFNTTSNTSAQMNWFQGGGDSSAVFVKQTTTGLPAPDFNTYYQPNSIFGSGSPIGATGWYCVYKGRGSSVTVTNLAPNTMYRAMVMAFNGTHPFQEYNAGLNAGFGNNVSNFTTLLYPLPVHFGNVDAKSRNCNVDISFETLSETGNNYFVIERSPDASDWNTLAILQSRGNSGSAVTYTYTDLLPLKGKNYYRIKQVDRDNQYTYTKTVFVQNDCNANPFEVYPNPATGHFQVILPGDDHKASILLYDMAGRPVSRRVTANGNNRTVNVTDMPTGNYLLKVISQGKVFTHLITIHR
jgi:hypothetical protein